MLPENELIAFLVEQFGWPNDEESLFHALLIVRKARQQEVPSWDDFKAGR